MTVLGLFGILSAHFIADFVYQTDEMAKNKSKSNVWLGKHIVVYTAVLMIDLLLIKLISFNTDSFMSYRDIVLFALFNGAVHFPVDYVTSRVSSKLYAQGRVHDFFEVVGLDQLIHTMTLIASYNYLITN